MPPVGSLACVVQFVAGRFALVDRIGRGASGTVWRAFDKRLGRYCAAKLIDPKGSESILWVVREQGIRLTHPHVACPYAWAADEDIVIAIDLVTGGSLSTLVRDHGPLPAGYAARILWQLLDALAHVHKAGLVHRDVKPTNVLMDATGTGAPHSRLGDFGIALPDDAPRLTQTGVVVGTPGYLPPEAITGTRPNASRDLYAAGVTGWQLLTGEEHPPDRAEFGERPDSVDGALWQVVMRLLAADPDDRPASATDAAAMVDALIGDDTLRLPAQTAYGSPVEVLDLVGPLPAGWGPGGPAESSAPPAAPKPAAMPVPPVRTLDSASAHRTPTPQDHIPTTPPLSRPPQSRQPQSRPPQSPPRPVPLSPPAPPAAAWAPRPKRRRGRLIAALAAGAAAVGTAAVLLVAQPWSGDGSDEPPGRDTSPTPTTGTRPPEDSVRAGGECGFLEVGHVETAGDGQQVRCTQSGETQTWQPVR